MDLPLIFGFVAAGAVGLYVLADGFDLGAGLLFLLAPREQDRDVMMESIAPLWDGNETWLVFGGALLWTAFPIGYYVLLPAFYLPLMIMLFALIFRGIAFEFRFQAKLFQRVWDYAFAGGSLLAVLAQGFVLGGFIGGVPVENGVFSGGPFNFFTVLGLLCAAGLVGGYAMLGAGWLIWKTNGPTQIFGREVGHAAVILTAACMALVGAWTAFTVPEVAERWFGWPRVLLLGVGALGGLKRMVGCPPIPLSWPSRCRTSTTLIVVTTSQRCRSRCRTGRRMKLGCVGVAACFCGSRTACWNTGRPVDRTGRLATRTRPSRPA